MFGRGPGGVRELKMCQPALMVTHWETMLKESDEPGRDQESSEGELSLILCKAEAIQWLSQPFCPGALWSLTFGLYAGSKPELGRELLW